MNYLLVFYTDDKITAKKLARGENITVGTGENDTLRISDNGLSANHLLLRATDCGINIFSNTPFSIMGNKAVNRILSAGDNLAITERTSLTVLENCCDCNNIISLNKLNEIKIGRSSKNDICLQGSLVSSSHAVLRKNQNKWLIKDRHSHNGIFVDGKLINSTTELNNGAIIFIGGFILEFIDNTLRFKNTPGNVIFSGLIIREVLPSFNIKRPQNLFYRSPRIRKTAMSAEVEVLSPPSTGTRPSVSWLAVLLPPGMMITIMLCIAAFTRNAYTLMYTLPMSSVSIMMAVINYRSQKNKWLQIQELAKNKYHEHLREKEIEIIQAETEYIYTLSSINPGILECIDIAKRRERRLWERTLSDSDFLNIRLGTGEIISNVEVKIPKEQLVLEENPFLKEAAQLKARHEILSGVPVCHSFMEAPITGLEGTRDSVKKVAWTILINIATHHSYEDIKIVCIYPEREKEQWEWIRWLPHVWNSEKTRRFMSCTLVNNEDSSIQKHKKRQDKTARTLLRELAEILKVRRRDNLDNNRDKLPETPFYFLVLADENLVESSGEQFLPESSSLGFAVLYAYGDIRKLPKECNAIINCGDFENRINADIQMTSMSENRQIFIPDSMYTQLNTVENFSRQLAPIKVQTSGRSGNIPSKALFLNGLGVTKVEDINLLQRWKNSQSYASLAVPIGFKGNSDIFEFDAHEKFMGPHGLVAGTSGSGKSEMLTTWLLSLAVHFSPEDVNFLLIEFKGNDLSNILRTLPHVAGIVSNLQDSSSIERSLRSLRGEIARRQRLFENAEDLATKAIFEYQKYQKQHPDKNLEPMPYLIVVVDEFAEFKNQFPDQMTEFISIARVGRSLGLYMVLATQSPGGIVAGQVSANTKFRICLKTAEVGESKDMIGTPDAFHISLPGRAYIKVGNNEVYEQVQTFYSKAPYYPEQENNKRLSEINLIDINGEKINPEIYDKSISPFSDVFSEGQAVVNYINTTSENNNILRAKPIWTEALPEILDLTVLNGQYKELAFNNNSWSEINSGLSFIVGLLDNPEQQRQEPFILDFIKDGHQIIYGAPSSGKTTFLQTAILSAALSYTPEQLQFLVFDFGNWGMKIFEGLPHMLMVADPNDKEKLQQAEKYFLNEIDSRKRLFAEQGVGTLEAYLQVSGKNLPNILIAVDNLAALNTQYPDMLDSIVKVAREGGGLGIYLILTSTGSSMFRIDQFIKIKHALQLTDPTEYRALVGGSARQEPGHFPGRGFTKGPLEFQTALCVMGSTEGERVINLREICTSMKNLWSGENASIEEAENREINFDDLNSSSESFQIGINKISKQPVEFILSEMSTCIISGMSNESVKNVFLLIINAISKNFDNSIYIYEKGNEISSLYPDCIYVHDPDESNSLISQLADEFDRRNQDYENTNFQRIIFCIDDFLGFYRSISQESADILETLTRSGADFNIYIYLASSIEDLAFLDTFRSSIKPFENCLNNGNAIIAGGNINEYSAFKNMHQETDMIFSESEGCLIHAGKVTSLKFAKAGTK